jgi:hypothetical protein
MIKRILWLLLLVPFSLAAAETGYKIVHPDGTVEFTDDPHRGGEPIELKEAPTFKSLPIHPSSTPAAGTPKPDAQKVSRYQSINITSPKPGQTFWFDGTGINFTVDIEPALNASDEIVIELDGKEVARGKENSFIVNGIYRGEHQVAAQVVDSKGETLLKSSPVIFYMQRHTTNKP